MEAGEGGQKKFLDEWARRKGLRLDDSMEYRMANLMEEIGEILQAMGKAAIFGMENWHLEKEIGDFLAAVSVLQEHGDISQQRVLIAAVTKWAQLTGMEKDIRDRAIQKIMRDGHAPCFIQWPPEGAGDPLEPERDESGLSLVAGGHDYTQHDGTNDCKTGCGAWLGPYKSGGPDPWGKCPKWDGKER